MARAIKGGQYAVTATATSITDALSLTGNRFFTKIVVKNAEGAANSLYLGNSNVTNVPANAHVELGQGVSFTFGGDAGQGYYDTDSIYLVGTANAANIAFISLEE